MDADSLANAGGLWGILSGHTKSVDWLALSIAMLIPVLMIYTRNEIRRRRLRCIIDYVSSYPETRNSRTTPDFYGQVGNPALEFVTSKYMADLDSNTDARAASNSATLIKSIEQLIDHSWLFGNPGDLRLLLSSVGFVILCYYGFYHLHHVIAAGLQIDVSSGNFFCSPPNSLPTCLCGEASCTREFPVEQLRIVGSLAFAGAMIAASRAFVRSLAIFDLSAYTFLWQTVEILASVLIVLFLYRAFPDPFAQIGTAAFGTQNSCGNCQQVPWVWVALAPLLGLLPQSSTKFLLLRVQSLITWIKLDDDRFNSITRSTPLDVIDGIDYTTRFRLEEWGIYDIQNLATYNPIELYIESPYGIYQTIDWVAQAQLCSILGLDRFLLLRELNVRTIFDLERAIDYSRTRKSNTPDEHERQNTDEPTSDIVKNTAIDAFDVIYAGILFAATAKMSQIGKISGMTPLIIGEEDDKPASSIHPAPDSFENNQTNEGQPPQNEDAKQAEEHHARQKDELNQTSNKRRRIIEADIETFCAWARQQIEADSDKTTRCVEYLMSWMADDLHVRRLRRIWQEMGDSLGERSEKLNNRKTTQTTF